MKSTYILTGLVLLASPVVAQTGPTTTNGIPDTALSTATTPSTGPRSREADLQPNTAARAEQSMLAVAPQSTLPAPALDPYPLCKAGEFDHCMEPGNGPAKKHRRSKRPR